MRHAQDEYHQSSVVDRVHDPIIAHSDPPGFGISLAYAVDIAVRSALSG
ncbi:hypothetical protein BQ8420_21230 [Nocardiopsis sp. JB363]|nr:hypothetical protein BQ8420_21230 [Nocardiopsis sp. JB363]